MPFAPQEFRAALQFDGARPNLFQVSLTFPVLPGGGGAGTATVDPLQAHTAMTFMCRSSQLPGKNHAPIPVPYYGRQIKVPGNVVYDDWTVTVINDEDFRVRTALEVWMNALNGARSNLRAMNFINNTQYGADMFVIQYSKTGPLLKSYHGVGVWPSVMAPIDLDWAANDAVMEFQCTLAIQWWEQTGAGENQTGMSPPLYNVELI